MGTLINTKNITVQFSDTYRFSAQLHRNHVSGALRPSVNGEAEDLQWRL